MTRKIILPAIRSRVGDWSFYVTTMRFEDVATYVKSPDEVHESKRLAEWIQREAIDSHAESISDYILGSEQRFLGSLIVGVYGGHPDWSPLKIKVDNLENVDEEQLDRIEGALGLLHLSGEEKLFPVDGQHRVAGIKKALSRCSEEDEIKSDCVSAVFVSHNPSSSEGVARTRRLFTTLNKRAKAVSKSQTIALDEDNGFAIVTRRLIDSHPLFRGENSRVAFNSSGSLSASDKTSITSVVGLYELVKDLYGGSASKFDQRRPSESELEGHEKLCHGFFDGLIKAVPEFGSVFVRNEFDAASFRTSEKNHLLFRPLGQRAFARATQLLVSRGFVLEEAISKLASANLNILDECWAHILWNPVANTMMMGTLIVAEAQLLKLVNEKPRNAASMKKLERILAAK